MPRPSFLCLRRGYSCLCVCSDAEPALDVEIAHVESRFYGGALVVFPLFYQSAQIIGKYPAEEVETGIAGKGTAVGKHTVVGAECGIFRDDGKIFAYPFHRIVEPPRSARLHVLECARYARERGQIGIV